LKYGDSGSWVVDKTTGHVYGHIIAVDPLGEALVAPMLSVMEEISSRLGNCIVYLPTSHQELPLPDTTDTMSNSCSTDLISSRYSRSSRGSIDMGSSRDSDISSVCSYSLSTAPKPPALARPATEVPGLIHIDSDRTASLATRRTRRPKIFIEHRDGRPYFAQEKPIRQDNSRVHRQDHCAKAALEAADRDLEAQAREIQSLRAQLNQLTSMARENQELRLSVGGIDEIEARYKWQNMELQHNNARLKHENEGLKMRIRDLTRNIKEAVDERVTLMENEIHTLGVDVSTWRRRHEDVNRRYERLRGNMETQMEANSRLKDENEALRTRLVADDRVVRRRRDYYYE
jgi:hypothetical protein